MTGQSVEPDPTADGSLLRELRLRVTQLANEGGELALPDLAAEVRQRLGWVWSSVFSVDLLGRPAPVWSEIDTDDPAFPHGDDLERLHTSVASPHLQEVKVSTGHRLLIAPIGSAARVEQLLVFGLRPDSDLPTATLEALEDVRSQTALLLERRRVVRELERSNAELARFASVASHDLQEPLRKITGFLSLLQERYADELDDVAREYIGFAVGGATRMQQLINDLLAYARIGQGDTSPVTVDLAALVTDIAAGFDLPADTIRVGQLPTISGYRAELRQLFTNLVGNAVKFAGPHGPDVDVRASRARGRWIIEVADQGIGIPADQIDQVFEAFFRGHPARRYPGTGIGLGICRKVVEHHDGTITATSEPGVGTTIRIDLPGASL